MDISGISNKFLLFVSVSSANIAVSYDLEENLPENKPKYSQKRQFHEESNLNYFDNLPYKLVDLDERLENAIVSFSKKISKNSFDMDHYYADVVDEYFDEL